ncbi:MAG TPA: hypothetical protein VMA97_14235 [Streptosporangiaceae bacterium]|nr:hypothetical protein [Streptosporangiaceae bacterium]
MSVADQIHDHQARCVAPLISLQMLAQGEAGTPLPRWVVVEVAQATSAVLAEAEAAGRVALAAVGAGAGHPGGETFLRVRLDRLAAAASDAITAAHNADCGEMRRHLRRFEALTSAIWTVQDAVYGSRQVSAAPLAADRRLSLGRASCIITRSKTS